MSEDVVLYINAAGKAITHGSFSARSAFRYCPQRFKLEKIDGWKQKAQNIASPFGTAVEHALTAHEKQHREPGTGVSSFLALWAEIPKLKHFPEFIYTKKDGSYDDLTRAGREMLQIYEARAPYLPISPYRLQPQTAFQVKAEKVIFPGSPLQALTDKAYLDILTYPPWDHPMLAPAPQTAVRPLIIDVKVYGKAMPYDMIKRDEQLLDYAWKMKILDLAFLWFTKANHKLKKKKRVTLLEPFQMANGKTYKAGYECFVLNVLGNESVDIAVDWETFDALQTKLKGISGSSNKAKLVYHDFILENHGLKVMRVAPSSLSTQRLQFAAVRVSEEDIQERGRLVGIDTVEMVRAHRENFYPKTGGIRYPNDKCLKCPMRGICLDKPELRDKLLTRAGEEWLG